MKNKSLLIFALVVFLLIGFEVVSAEVECGNIPTDGCIVTQNTVFTPGTYNLPSGISIGASHIFLDCNGSTLIGNGSGIGIFNTYPGFDNVTIKNCNILNYAKGISIEYASFNTVYNNTVSSNDDGIFIGHWSNFNTVSSNTARSNKYGIHLYDTSNNLITNNIANSNHGDGILLIQSSSNKITNNTANSNGHGIRVGLWSDNNVITDNTANSNNYSGIYLYSSDNTTITNNIANSNKQGIHLYYTSNNKISNNNVTSNDRGIYLDSSSSNTLTNNNASKNDNFGIYLHFSSDVIIANNSANHNSKSGFALYYSNDNNITSNNASNNNNGFYFWESLDNTLNDNDAYSNEDNGITFWGGSQRNVAINNRAWLNSENGFSCWSSDNNVFIRNRAWSNGYGPGMGLAGFYLYYSYNNNLTDNNISNNHYGVRLDNSHNSTIFNNIVTSNNVTGIYSGNSYSNTIANNYFDNTNNAWDDGVNNWNITKTPGKNIIGREFLGGNYWSDYTGNDTSSPPDGIGDTLLPHNSGGNIQNRGDWLPLVLVPSYSFTYNVTATIVEAPFTCEICGSGNVTDIDFDRFIVDIGDACGSTVIDIKNMSITFNDTTYYGDPESDIFITNKSADIYAWIVSDPDYELHASKKVAEEIDHPFDYVIFANGTNSPNQTFNYTITAFGKEDYENKIEQPYSCSLRKKATFRKECEEEGYCSKWAPGGYEYYDCQWRDKSAKGEHYIYTPPLLGNPFKVNVKYCNRGWWRTGWVNLVYTLNAEGIFTRDWSKSQSGYGGNVTNGEEAKHIATYNLGNGSGKSDTVLGSAYLSGYKPPESDNPNVELSMNDSGLFAITFYTEPWGSTKEGNSSINKSENIKNITEHNVSAPNNDTKFSVDISVDCIGCPHPVKYRDLNGDGIVECGQYIAWMDGFIIDTGPIDYILYAAMNATPPTAYIDNITNETGVNVRGGVALFGENVTFKGHGEPDEENNIVDWFWKSHKDGRIGSNASFTTSFLSPANPHHIYFYVKSKAGLWSPSSPESRDKIIVNKPPTAFIRHIKGRIDDTGQIIAVVDEEVEFSGFGFDTDGYIDESGYEWYIDDEPVSINPIFSHIFNGTDVGSHIVTFRVKDDKVTWSKNVSKEITVIRNPVLLVHDYLRSPSEMEKMKNALEEENYSVYTVDLRKPTDFIVEFTYPIDSPAFETLAAFGQLLISGRELESDLKELAAWHGGDDPEVVTLKNNIRNDIFNLRSALYLIRGRVEDQPALKAGIKEFDDKLAYIEEHLDDIDHAFAIPDFEDIIKDLKSKFKFEYKVVDNKEYKMKDISIPVPVPDKAKPILQVLIATGKIKIPGQATIFSKEMTYKKDELSATAGLKLILKDIRPEFGDDGIKLKGSLYISDISFELDPPDFDSMPYSIKFAEAKFDATFVDGEVKAEAIIPGGKSKTQEEIDNEIYEESRFVKIMVTKDVARLRHSPGKELDGFPEYVVIVSHYKNNPTKFNWGGPGFIDHNVFEVTRDSTIENGKFDCNNEDDLYYSFYDTDKEAPPNNGRLPGSNRKLYFANFDKDCENYHYPLAITFGDKFGYIKEGGKGYDIICYDIINDIKPGPKVDETAIVGGMAFHPEWPGTGGSDGCLTFRDGTKYNAFLKYIHFKPNPSHRPLDDGKVFVIIQDRHNYEDPDQYCRKNYGDDYKCKPNGKCEENPGSKGGNGNNGNNNPNEEPEPQNTPMLKVRLNLGTSLLKLNLANQDIKQSAKEVGNKIDEIKEEVGVDKVDIVGSGMGGMAAHYYTNYGYRYDVRKLVLIGAPLHGSDLIKEGPKVAKLLIDALASQVPAVGNIIGEFAKALLDVVLGPAAKQMESGSSLVKRLNLNNKCPAPEWKFYHYDGDHDFTNPNVDYHVVAGVGPKVGSVPLPLTLSHVHMEIPVIGTVVTTPFLWKGDLFVNTISAGLDGVVTNEVESFSSWHWWLASNEQTRGYTKQFLEDDPPERSWEMEDINETLNKTAYQLIGPIEGSVNHSENRTHNVTLDSIATNATFKLQYKAVNAFWNDTLEVYEECYNNLSLCLIKPDQTIIGPSDADGNIKYLETYGMVIYSIDVLEPGNWTLFINGTNVTCEKAEYSASITYKTNLRVSMSAGNESYEPGDNVTIYAYVEYDGSALPGANVTAYIGRFANFTLNGTMPLDELILYDDGQHNDNQLDDGFFANNYTNTSLQDAYSVNVVASINLSSINMGDKVINRSVSGVFFVELLPDLTLSQSDISFSTASPYNGDNVVITASIHNLRKANATNAEIEFRDDNKTIGFDVINVTGLGTEIANVSWNATYGNHLIYVIISPFNSFMEKNYTNNTASKQIFVDDNTLPIADAGPDQTARNGTLVFFDGSKSEDDDRIVSYEWDTDIENSTDINLTDVYNFTKGYNNVGVYTVKLTVRDAAGNIGIDTLNVTVVEDYDMEEPIAFAGLPQEVMIREPIYFTGCGAYDNYGIASFIWDVDIAKDSDLDGIPDNDVDLITQHPLLENGYYVPGKYIVKLTVDDVAGNGPVSDYTTVIVRDPKKYICVGDKDCDGVFDDEDNCPDVHNPDQADYDKDGVGDACMCTVIVPPFGIIQDYIDSANESDVICLTSDAIYFERVNVTKNNITLDGLGAMIYGDGIGNGITIDSDVNNVTVQNCFLTNHSKGFMIFGNNNKLTENIVVENNDMGILDQGNYNQFLYNTVNSNANTGFNLAGSGGKIEDNKVCNNSLDIKMTGSGYSGDYNICNTTSGWNDGGTTGCTFSCACVIPTNGMNVDSNTLFCSGTYDLPDGINVIASNIAIKGNNTILNGTGLSGSVGIEVRNCDNIAIMNCGVQNYEYGIMLYPSSYSFVANNEILRNEYGLGILDSSNSNTIINNEVSDNSLQGIRLYSSINNTLIDNDCSNNYIGIMLGYLSHYNSLKDNNILDSSSDGIYLYSSNHNKLKNNNVLNNGRWGVVLSGSHHNTLVSNSISNTLGNDSVAVFDGNYNNFSNNEVYNGLLNGFLLQNSRGSTFSKNYVHDTARGFLLQNSDGNQIKSEIIENTAIGIQLSHSSNNTISSNDISENNFISIYINYSLGNYVHDNIFNEIYLDNSSSNTIINNKATDQNFGISLANSSYNTIKGNYNASIDLHNSSANTIINNKVTDQIFGILLESCFDNTISSNSAIYNTYGCIVANSSNNTISDNVLNYNDVGIYFEYSEFQSVERNLVCYNKITDFFLNNSLNNSGNDNICDKPHRWNDTGVIGCSCRCPGYIREFIVASINDSIYYYLSYGNGTFGGKVLIDTLGGNPKTNDIVGRLADFDNDGDLDLIIDTSSMYSDVIHLYLYINDGFDFITRAWCSYLQPVTPGVWGEYSRITAADFNNDGYYDFIASRSHESNVSFYLFINNKDNTFTKRLLTIDTDWAVHPKEIEAGDFNYDGNMDFLLADYESGGIFNEKVSLYLGDGTGNFNYNGLAFTVPNPIGTMASGYFNNDTYPDVIAGLDGDRDAGAMWRFLNNGDGTFTLDGEVIDLAPGYESGQGNPGGGHADAYDFDHANGLDVVASVSNHSTPAGWFNVLYYINKTLGGEIIKPEDAMVVDSGVNLSLIAVPEIEPKPKPPEEWWPMLHHDLRHTGYSTSVAPDTDDRVWVKDIGSRILSSPAIIDGKVFITSENRRVYCLNESTGALIWDQSIGGYGWSSPAVHENKVFVGASDGKVYCLNATTGGINWEYQTDANVQSSPAVADGKVFIGSHDGYMYCLDETTGSFIWSYPTGEIHMSSPAVADGKVFIGSYDHNVYCLDEGTGSFIWNFTTGINIESSPAVVDNKVFIGGLDHYFYCLDEATGTLLWSYFVGDDERIWSTPAVADGKVFFGTSGNEYGVYCLDETTGSFIWKYSTENHVESSPAVADGKVYFGSRDTYVYCVDELTGALIWKYKTGNIIYSSPAIANGKVFIGSHDNKVYAFGSAKFIAHFMTPEGEPYPFDVIISDGTWRKEFKNVTYVETEVPCNATYTLVYSVFTDWGPLKHVSRFPFTFLPGEMKEFEFYAINLTEVEPRIRPYISGQESGANASLSWDWNSTSQTLTWYCETVANKHAAITVYINNPIETEFFVVDSTEPVLYASETFWKDFTDATGSSITGLDGSMDMIESPSETISVKFQKIDPSYGGIRIAGILCNDNLIGPISVTLRDMSGEEYEPFVDPEYAVPSGNYVLQIEDLPEPYVSIRLPLNVSNGKWIRMDIYAPRAVNLQPSAFSVTAEFFSAHSSYSNLTHDEETNMLSVDVSTKTDYDWWGSFVLPDTATVAAVRSYDGMAWHDLDELYDYTINPVDGYKIVVVRISPTVERLSLKYVDPWTKINKELDELIAKVNAATVPSIIKRILVDKLEYAKTSVENAKIAHEAGNDAQAKKYLGVAKNQIESFEHIVKITRQIKPADKEIFLRESAKIKEKMDALIESL